MHFIPLYSNRVKLSKVFAVLNSLVEAMKPSSGYIAQNSVSSKMVS